MVRVFPLFKLNLANPYFIRQLPRRKSDVKDARWIAECTGKVLIRGSFVPPEVIQQLCLYDRIFDLNREIARNLSKIDAVPQRCNIRLSNYVSNIDGKSYKAVVKGISEEITDLEELVKLIHGHHRQPSRQRHHPRLAQRRGQPCRDRHDSTAA